MPSQVSKRLIGRLLKQIHDPIYVCTWLTSATRRHRTRPDPDNPDAGRQPPATRLARGQRLSGSRGQSRLLEYAGGMERH